MGHVCLSVMNKSTALFLSGEGLGIVNVLLVRWVSAQSCIKSTSCDAKGRDDHFGDVSSDL